MKRRERGANQAIKHSSLRLFPVLSSRTQEATATPMQPGVPPHPHRWLARVRGRFPSASELPARLSGDQTRCYGWQRDTKEHAMHVINACPFATMPLVHAGILAWIDSEHSSLSLSSPQSCSRYQASSHLQARAQTRPGVRK